MALAKNRKPISSNGASFDALTVPEDDPIWRHTGVPVSWQAAKNGSQWVVWTDGYPSRSGFSENVTALKPRSALRRISAAATAGSESQGSWQGMIRSGYGPAQASRCQSL